MQADYIKKIICEAYKAEIDKKVIFVKYYLLKNQAWLDYQNIKEGTTPHDRTFDKDTSTFTMILNEHQVTNGLSYEKLHIFSDGKYTTYNLLTRVGKIAGYPNLPECHTCCTMIN